MTNHCHFSVAETHNGNDTHNKLWNFQNATDILLTRNIYKN